MLVFVDESGDTGLKLTKGSSKYFTIALVVFNDPDEAIRCDQRIELLRAEMGLGENFEFHFKNDSSNVRKQFLKAIHPYQFNYFAVVIDKLKLYGDEFGVKESFYRYVCNMVFTNAMPYLDNAIVTMDHSGSTAFNSQLHKYLNIKIRYQGKKILKRIKTEKSHSNNLLQLTDYVCGVVNRKIHNKKSWEEFYKFLSHKEIYVQVWPK